MSASVADAPAPRSGDRYRARVDTAVRLSIAYAAPGTGSANAVLPMGEVITIHSVPPGVGWAFAQPERRGLESVLVPKEELEWPTYGGFALVIELSSLISNFEPIPPAA